MLVVHSVVVDVVVVVVGAVDAVTAERLPGRADAVKTTATAVDGVAAAR
jgi:hypothetical protein